MNSERMLMQGFERVGDQGDPAGPVIKQEGAIQIMVEQPIHIARTSQRSSE